MPKAIYKFTLAIEGIQTVDMPTDAKVLSCQFQNGTLCVWALCSTEANNQPRRFYIWGTGHLIDNYFTDVKFIATVQNGPLVLHVFEELTK